MVLVLIGEVVGVAVVVVAVAAVVLRRRAHDDEHSVQHYHQRLHTLEELRTHESPGEALEGQPPCLDRVEHFPVSAVRVPGSITVRLTEQGSPAVPPVPLPPSAGSSGPITFDDTAGPESARRSFMTGTEDRALHSINHRPRRLGGPLAAVAAVAALVVVLVVTGFHTTASHHPHRGTGTGAGAGRGVAVPGAPPLLAGPQAVSAHRAVYQVAVENYALTLSATAAGPCPVAAGVPARKLVLYSATLAPGQAHTVTARGGVTVIAGSARTCAVGVNGTAAKLPAGARSPFTLVFRPATATG